MADCTSVNESNPNRADMQYYERQQIAAYKKQLEKQNIKQNNKNNGAKEAEKKSQICRVCNGKGYYRQKGLDFPCCSARSARDCKGKGGKLIAAIATAVVIGDISGFGS